MRPDSFDYESHKDWAERVPDTRPDHTPGRPNGAAIAAIFTLGAVVLTLTVCWTLLITGVLVWR